MAAAGIRELPLYYEDRASKSPTVARVLDLLDPLARTVVIHHDRLLALHEPALDPPQEQICALLGVGTKP